MSSPPETAQVPLTPGALKEVEDFVRDVAEAAVLSGQCLKVRGWIGA